MTKDVRRDLLGAIAKCRSDFRAAKLWPELGFQLRGIRPAKTVGKTLDVWWYDFSRPNLFTAQDPPLRAVLDSSVFIDIADVEAEHHRQSRLIVDFGDPEAYILLITPELWDDIRRSKEKAKRDAAFDYARQFEQTHARSQDVDSTLGQIVQLLGEPQTRRDKSDYRQLAHAISGHAALFITRDEGLLKRRQSMQSKFGITILRPVELVRQYDKDLRPSAYAVTRLDGSNIDIQLMQPGELNSIVDHFLNRAMGEPKVALRQLLSAAIADPKRYVVEVLSDSGSKPIGLTVVDISNPPIREIIVLRAIAGPMAVLMATHLIWRQVIDASKETFSLVRFVDGFSPSSTREALAAIGFIEDKYVWNKATVGTLGEQDEILSLLARKVALGTCPIGILSMATDLLGAPPILRQSAMHKLEKLIWPAKVSSSGIPSFVVPIQPRWAQELFDSRASAKMIFGADFTRLLSFENVYYRSAHQKVPYPLSRVLWYVSSGKQSDRSKVICGSSLINEVAVGTPRRLFRSFERFGVYRLDDLYEIQPRTAGSLMAFTFSHTSLFPRAVPYREAREYLLRSTGKDHHFQSPVLLNEQAWLGLYSLGYPEGVLQ